jgi:hypothetical protein
MNLYWLAFLNGRLAQPLLESLATIVRSIGCPNVYLFDWFICWIFLKSAIFHKFLSAFQVLSDRSDSCNLKNLQWCLSPQ